MLGAVSKRAIQIWHLSYPGGEGRQLTDDFRRNGLTSITADSSTMVGAQADRLTDMWVAPVGNDSGARQITSSEQGGVGIDSSWMSWTPDGKIVYTSNASGNFDIWLMNADGTNNKQLTFDPSFDSSPVMTPDGRYIVLPPTAQGSRLIWISGEWMLTAVTRNN
jgi:TolB protein